MSHQHSNTQRTESTSGEAVNALSDLLSNAQAALLAGHAIAHHAIAYGGAGQSPSDLSGQLLMPIKTLLELADAQADKLRMVLEDADDPHAANSGDPENGALDLLRTVDGFLLSALAIAAYADECGDAGDSTGDTSGHLMLPIKMLLTDSNHKFSELETALMRAERKNSEAALTVQS